MAAPFVTSLTLPTPVGVLPGDLMIAVLALTYAPHVVPTPACPGPVAIISPPPPPFALWSTVLSDFPGGELAMGDFGAGPECDRLAVFARNVGPGEPPGHTFSWVPGGAVSAAGFIKAFRGVGASFPSVDAAAAAVRIIAPAGGNPFTVESPSITPTRGSTILMSIFCARNGLFPAPGGTPFTIPAGMIDATPALNLQTAFPVVNPLGLAAFLESLPTTAATGVRVSSVDQDDAPPNLFQGMGYALCIAGCGGAPGEPPG